MAWREIRRYGLAVGAVAAAVLVARVLDPWIAPHISGPYFLAVMLVAAYAGAGPGLLATFLASFAIAWFDLGTAFKLDLGVDDLVRLAVFTVTALVISSISAARKAAERDLRQALDDLAALDRSKDEFIATVSHELRTPLTSILGWLKILRVRDLDEETRELALESIEQSARTQAMLVSDMLDASRIVLGKLHVEREPLFVRDVVADAVAVIKPDADARKMTIDIQGTDDTVVIGGDRQRLKQVVWNLLSNAVKFAPDGGTIRVRVLHDQHDAVIEVAEDGEGIDPELLRHIFDRFTQGAGSIRKGGLGLGLSIVRHIVELHGGRVSAYSAGKDRGATFTVTLPLLRDAEARRRLPRQPEVPPIRSVEGGARAIGTSEILLVDTDPAHGGRIEESLVRAGYVVDTITHEAAVAHISREDMSRYAAVIVALTDEPSTLSDTYRLGEYVLHYLEQLCPEVLPRVVVTTPSAELARTASPLSRVVVEPAAAEELVAEVRSVVA